MSTVKKISGRQSAKLGWRERKILLIMLKHDEPPGHPIALFNHLCRECGIYYDDVLPKSWQKEKFKEERLYRQSIRYLVKRSLIRQAFVAPKGQPPDPKVFGYSFFTLTRDGRKTAEKVLREKELDYLMEARNEDLRRTVKMLEDQGYNEVTLKQVLELLWRISHGKFENKEEFEKYWNGRRLGLMLRDLVAKRTRISEKDGRRKYILRSRHEKEK